jgi:hypothetical protein
MISYGIADSRIQRSVKALVLLFSGGPVAEMRPLRCARQTLQFGVVAGGPLTWGG